MTVSWWEEAYSDKTGKIWSIIGNGEESEINGLMVWCTHSKASCNDKIRHAPGRLPPSNIMIIKQTKWISTDFSHLMDTKLSVLGYRKHRDAVSGHNLILGVQALHQCKAALLSVISFNMTIHVHSSCSPIALNSAANGTLCHRDPWTSTFRLGNPSRDELRQYGDPNR